MRRPFYHDRFLRNTARTLGTEVVRRGRILLPTAFFLALTCLPWSASPATELANPMEKLFSGAEEEPQIPSGRSGRFSDQTLPDQTQSQQIQPPPARASSSTAKKKGSEIRQTSGQASETTAVNAEVWNRVATSADNETTLADWGVKPSSPSNGGYFPDMPGFGAMNGFSPRGVQYSNTGTAMPASPAPSNPDDMGGFGYGTGMAPSAADYGYYGGIPQNGFQPYHPYAASGMADPYGVYGNMYGASGMPGYYNPYDPYGAAGQNPAQQQLTLYQAMLQQEAIRREVEREAEEEERAAREAEEQDAPQSVNPLMPLHVTSPLGKTLVSCAKTLSPFSTPTGPHRGVGQPLSGVSWLDRPWYFGGFCGWISGSELVKNMIDQKDGGMGGLILGYNLSEFWGVEGRVHFASIDIRETANGRQVFKDWYNQLYPGSTFAPTLTTRTNQLSVLDVSVHYYPLGDAKWRPYFKYGLGLARENFVDTYGIKRRENTMTMPLGVGLRYWWNKNLAIQVDLVDNVVFSSGNARTQNNFAFCVGLTYSFGTSKKKRPTILWPYVPSHGSKR